jgi:hypothetical protein
VAPKARTKEEEQASLATNARQAGPFRKLLQAPPVLLAGDYVFQFDTGLPGGWGNGYDTKAGDLWIGNLLGLGGDDKNYRFLTNGTNTGDTISQPWVSVFAADLTYNTRTGMLWQVNVGGDNCLYEMDPVAKTSTGNKICADFGTSMRGLAYNAVDDTYFVGTWNNGGFIMEIDKNGNILRNNNIGLAISGLAYNGSTGHVFAQVNDASQLVYVLDARANFAIRGAFSLSDQAGNPAYAAFEGAGMEMDCQGVLWSVNQVTQKVFANTSGETAPASQTSPGSARIPPPARWRRAPRPPRV